ncbi:hypothetical protein PG996_008070 [Apiospora saccharicola]|uniref:Uncharacterized protein n=1 Tax=Apiospora saccharicola TaxID=335842 RepID=A0ABR1UWX0_9PEZI
MPGLLTVALTIPRRLSSASGMVEPVCHELDMSRNRGIVEQIAEYTVCVFDQALDGIASIYPAAADEV